MLKKVSRLIVFILTVLGVVAIGAVSSVEAFKDHFNIGMEYNNSLHFEFAVDPFDAKTTYTNPGLKDPDATPSPGPSKYNNVTSYAKLYAQSPALAQSFMDETVGQIHDRIDYVVKNRTNTNYSISYSLSSGVVTVDVSGLSNPDPEQKLNPSDINVFERQVMFNNVFTLMNPTAGTTYQKGFNYMSSFDFAANAASVSSAQGKSTININTTKTLGQTIPDLTKELDGVQLWSSYEDYFNFMKYQVGYQPKDKLSPPVWNDWRSAFNTWAGKDQNKNLVAPYFSVATIDKLTTDQASKSTLAVAYTGSEEQAKFIAGLINLGPYNNFKTSFIFDYNMSSRYASNSLMWSAIIGLIVLALLAIFFIFYYRLYGILLILAIVLFVGLSLWFYNYIQGEIGLDTIIAWILGTVLIIDTQVNFLQRIKEEYRKTKNPLKSYNFANSKTFGMILDSNVMTIVLVYSAFLIGISLTKGLSLFVLIVVLINIICIGLLQGAGWLLSRIVYKDNPKNVEKYAKLQQNVVVKPSKFAKINIFKAWFKITAVGLGSIALVGVGTFAAAQTIASNNHGNVGFLANLDDDYANNYEISILINATQDNKPGMSADDVGKLLLKDLKISGISKVTVSSAYGSTNGQINPNSNKNSNQIFNPSYLPRFGVPINAFMYQYSISKNSLSQATMDNLNSPLCSMVNTDAKCQIFPTINYLSTTMVINTQTSIIAQNTFDPTDGSKIKFFAITQTFAGSTNSILNNLVIAILVSIIPVLIYVFLRYGWRLSLAWAIGMIQVVGLLFALFTIIHLPLGIMFAPLVILVMAAYNFSVISIMSRIKERIRTFKVNKTTPSVTEIHTIVNDAIINSMAKILVVLGTIVVFAIGLSVIGFIMNSTNNGLNYVGIIIGLIFVLLTSISTMPLIFTAFEKLHHHLGGKLSKRRADNEIERKKKEGEVYLGEDEHVIPGIND